MVLEFEIPINIKEKSKGSGNIGKSGNVGKMSKAMETGSKKALNSLGIKKLLKQITSIALVLSALSFIITPVVTLLKAVLTLFFIPLIPIVSKIISFFTKGDKSPLQAARFAPQLKIAEDASMLSITIKSIINSLLRAASLFFAAGERIGQYLFDAIIKPLFDFGGKIGQWLFDAIITPISKWISDTILGNIAALKNLGQRIWELFKGLFKGTINVGVMVWDFFKSFFRGVINVATTVWSWFKGLFRGSGSSRSVNDAIITPQGVVHTNPSDYIIATKDPSSLGKGKITININNPTVRQDADIRKIANAVSVVLQRQMPGRISQ